MAPASLMSLPVELVHKICENLCRHCTCTPRELQKGDLSLNGEAALSCLSKTCRRLREIAQPVLYHYVETGRNWNFLRSIIARPDLAAHVRGLHHGWTSDSIREDVDIVAAIQAHKRLQTRIGAHEHYPRCSGHPHVLELISARLPNAEELAIDMDDMPRWESVIQLKSVRRLHLFAYDDIDCLDSLGSFLSAMPCLEGLNMQVEPWLSSSLPVTEVRSLDLEAKWLTAPNLTLMVKSCPKLERFRYHCVLQPGPEEGTLTWPQTQHILYPLRKTLKHVNFSNVPYGSPVPQQLRRDLGSFRNLDGLETLWMDISRAIPKRWKPRTPRFPANTTDVVDMLPESLRVVYFRGLDQRWHGIEMLASAIQGGHFPRLKTVVVQQVGAALNKSCRVLAAVGVGCESIPDASEDGRHIFPEGGFWETCG
ncbi:hypothetical protein J3F83DRAFT_733361 [Trichoderma novae-zelandiae]